MLTSFIDATGWHRSAALALPVLIGALAGACRLPEAQVPGPTRDDPALLEQTTDLLGAARASKVWTHKDQEAFNERLPLLTPESRLRLAKQWTGLITSKAIVLAGSPDQAAPPPKCTCVAAPCGNVGGVVDPANKN